MSVIKRELLIMMMGRDQVEAEGLGECDLPLLAPGFRVGPVDREEKFLGHALVEEPVLFTHRVRQRVQHPAAHGCLGFRV